MMMMRVSHVQVDGFALERVLDALAGPALAEADHEAAWLRGQAVSDSGVLDNNVLSDRDPDSLALSLCRNMIRSAGTSVRLTVRRPTFDPRKQASSTPLNPKP